VAGGGGRVSAVAPDGQTEKEQSGLPASESSKQQAQPDPYVHTTTGEEASGMVSLLKDFNLGGRNLLHGPHPVIQESANESQSRDDQSPLPQEHVQDDAYVFPGINEDTRQVQQETGDASQTLDHHGELAEQAAVSTADAQNMDSI